MNVYLTVVQWSVRCILLFILNERRVFDMYAICVLLSFVQTAPPPKSHLSYSLGCFVQLHVCVCCIIGCEQYHQICLFTQTICSAHFLWEVINIRTNHFALHEVCVLLYSIQYEKNNHELRARVILNCACVRKRTYTLLHRNTNENRVWQEQDHIRLCMRNDAWCAHTLLITNTQHESETEIESKSM